MFRSLGVIILAALICSCNGMPGFDSGNTSQNSNNEILVYPATETKQIAPSDGGTIKINNELEVFFPQNTLKKETVITASKGASQDNVAGFEEIITRTDPVKPMMLYDLTNSSAEVQGYFQITIRFDPTYIEKMNAALEMVLTSGNYLTSSDLDIYFFDYSQAKWVRTHATLDVQNSSLKLNTFRFGIYAIAFIPKQFSGGAIVPNPNHDLSVIEGKGFTISSLATKMFDYGDTYPLWPSPYLPGEGNGCSSVGKELDQTWGHIFTNSCYIHDHCYAHGNQSYGMSRADCDDQLFSKMSGKCWSEYPPFINVWFFIMPSASYFMYTVCEITASVVWSGVRIGAEANYNPNGSCADYEGRGGGVCDFPIIASITPSKNWLMNLDPVNITIDAFDQINSTLTYQWGASCAGTFNDTTLKNPSWTPDASIKNQYCDLTVAATNYKGTRSRSTKVWVGPPPPGMNDYKEFSQEYVMDMKTDTKGNIIIIKYTGSNYSIIKLDPQFTLLWEKNETLSGVAYYAATTDNQDNVYINTTSNLLKKFDPNGNLLWEIAANVSNWQLNKNPLAFDTSGYGYLLNRINANQINLKKINTDGTTVFEKNISSELSYTDVYAQIFSDRFNNLYLVLSGINSGGYEYFSTISQLNNNGDKVWSDTLSPTAGSLIPAILYNVGIDNKGNLYICTTSNIKKYDAFKNIIFSKDLTSELSYSSAPLHIDQEGNTYYYETASSPLTGQCGLWGGYISNAILMCYNSEGVKIWKKPFVKWKNNFRIQTFNAKLYVSGNTDSTICSELGLFRAPSFISVFDK